MDLRERLKELKRLSVDASEIVASLLDGASHAEADRPTEADVLRMQAATLESMRVDAFERHIELIEAYISAAEAVTTAEREQLGLRMQAAGHHAMGRVDEAREAERRANDMVRARVCARTKQAAALIALCDGGVLK